MHFLNKRTNNIYIYLQVLGRDRMHARSASQNVLKCAVFLIRSLHKGWHFVMMVIRDNKLPSLKKKKKKKKLIVWAFAVCIFNSPIISLFKLQPYFYFICNELKIMCTIRLRIIVASAGRHKKQSKKSTHNASAGTFRVIEFVRRAEWKMERNFVFLIFSVFSCDLFLLLRNSNGS